MQLFGAKQLVDIQNNKITRPLAHDPMNVLRPDAGDNLGRGLHVLLLDSDNTRDAVDDNAELTVLHIENDKAAEILVARLERSLA